MKLSKLQVAVAAAAMGVAGAGMAAPFVPDSGPIYFQFNNLEQLSLTNAIDTSGFTGGPLTEGNWGVFNLSSIQEGGVTIPHKDIAGGPVVWSDDGPGGSTGQIHGIFYGINNTSVTVVPPVLPSFPGSTIVTGTGGWMDVYWTEAGSDTITTSDLNGGFDDSDRTDYNKAGKFTDGTLLVRLAFAPGIIDGDATTTVLGDFTGTDIGSGSADFFADVVDMNSDGVIDALDGLWAPLMDQDWFFVDTDGNGVDGEAGERRDLRFSNKTDSLPSWGVPGGGTDGTNIIGLRSNDPGRVFVVPEPTSLALMGLGLMGVGFGSRLRARKA